MLPLVFLLTSCAVFDYHFGIGVPMQPGVLSRSPSTEGGVEYDAPVTLYAGVSWSPSTNKNHRESMAQRERHMLLARGHDSHGSSHGDITVTVEGSDSSVEADTNLDLPDMQVDMSAGASEEEDEHIITTVTETIPNDWSGGVGVLLWCAGVSGLLLVLHHIGLLGWIFNRRKRDAE